ncbi:unnamed protein product [Schistocephalus solidus]|uniref:Reverse transcriptase domain-containing protein n=1 Tax=Schistocephalus solidus TaxID=70667 RepID=A0A183SMF3_SCHSO|nr:unnamed protein product [Schistocephalus solidus]
MDPITSEIVVRAGHQVFLNIRPGDAGPGRNRGKHPHKLPEAVQKVGRIIDRTLRGWRDHLTKKLDSGVGNHFSGGTVKIRLESGAGSQQEPGKMVRLVLWIIRGA